MADWGHKTRVSIAAFRSLAELDAAVGALVAAGFVEDQIGLAAVETSVRDQRARAAADDPSARSSPILAAIIERFQSTPHRVAGAKILISEGSTGQLSGCFAHQENGRPSPGLMSTTRAKLLAQLYSGAWLLSANAQSYEQLRAGTRILLAHSSDRVETFELHSL